MFKASTFGLIEVYQEAHHTTPGGLYAHKLSSASQLASYGGVRDFLLFILLPLSVGFFSQEVDI